MLPKKQQSGAYARDDAWAAYLHGAGGWDVKIAENLDALLQLDTLAIDYGLSDENDWLPPGCEYLEEQLLLHDVPHEMMPYDGGHNSHVNKRIEGFVIPLFSANLPVA